MTHQLPRPKGQCDTSEQPCTEPGVHHVKDIGWLCKVHFAEFEERLKYFNGKMDNDLLERLR